MDETPKKPDEGESTLSNAAPPAWENVASPIYQAPPELIPPGGRYPRAQGYAPPQTAYPPNAYPPPAQPAYLPPPPPPPAAAAGQGGYQQVYGGGAAPGAPAYGPPVYGSQPPQYPPPQGYGGEQPPYGQPGYPPQNSYGQAPVAEMLAAAMLLPRWRRRRRHFILWPVLFMVFIVLFFMHGCMSILRGY
jgi:hypothetical protein